ncbi:4-(cytidine 5'-diphospho)-2-C-methyl-D-erythritol kinase [Microlunatus sp. Gsoil 973]|uniref:4-(cytidine 5'-diphospho)-2-C-methyl-D-erythritol kinase n=1 Tax=Microlunatus sp. Gsoil 973 TaxID=2672569 RepID=UPI0012B4CD70|nr:4-(cytidine 5'-diphospho)-2-C-methyl-D-erythritol kinase [Microlunatus sp. Gsoil 973]QGN33559.1 4-(cytidine 5'-diphospho)-2-C-methyl-D-erythritol kinase [Microlunatus sp. Gsoil 973]
MAEPILPGPLAVRVRAPAKINLTLRVGRPRPDGFHPLATVYQAVSLYEEVTASPADPGVIEVRVTGEGAEQVPADDHNLAHRAARLLAYQIGEPLGVTLRIEKAVPVAAGLAGGSADAAATLVACSLLWGLGLDHQDLLPLAAELGSDVPFALLGGTAVGSGRGESVAPALARGNYHWVLAFADGGLPTPAVYRRYDELGPTPPDPFEVSAGLMNALRNGDAEQLGRELINDLQAPALDLMPSLRKLVEAAEEYRALGVVVSGSGPTVAFLVASQADAVDLTVALSASGLCRSARYVTGPVTGARVLPT